MRDLLRDEFCVAMPQPTTSAVKPRLSKTAARDWRRYQLSFQRTDAPPPDGVEPGVSPTELRIGVERPQRIVYVTKLAVYRWITGLLHPTDPLLLYACGGLPSAAVCGHMRATQGFFKAPAFFLGDLDPGDLTVLLALTRGDPRLRSNRKGTSLHYAGVGDQLLELFRHRLSAAQFKVAMLDMTPDELSHFRLIRKIFLNIEDVIGMESMRLLDRGKKIELEGLLRWVRDGTKLHAELKSFIISAL